MSFSYLISILRQCLLFAFQLPYLFGQLLALMMMLLWVFLNFWFSTNSFCCWLIQTFKKHIKRRSRTALFFINVADKKLAEPTINQFYTNQSWPKTSRLRSCRKDSSRLLERLFSLNIDKLTTLIEPFCMLSLSTFQSKGHSQNLFHLRNIQKEVTFNSDLNKRIQKCCIHEGRLGKSTIIKLLPYSVNQDSKSDTKDKFHDFFYR